MTGDAKDVRGGKVKRLGQRERERERRIGISVHMYEIVKIRCRVGSQICTLVFVCVSVPTPKSVLLYSQVSRVSPGLHLILHVFLFDSPSSYLCSSY